MNGLPGGGPAPSPIRILLADDENLVRHAIGTLLSLEPDLRIAGHAASGTEALALARQLAPDVAVLDLAMPAPDGIEVTERLARDVPGCACVIVTSHARPGHLRRALAAGARGFLPKSASAHVLADAIRAAHQGRRYVDPELAAEAIAAGESPLTPREREVLSLAADGEPAERIAQLAHLSPGTVRNYLSAAITKLGVATRADAVRVAHEQGWI